MPVTAVGSAKGRSTSASAIQCELTIARCQLESAPSLVGQVERLDRRYPTIGRVFPSQNIGNGHLPGVVA